MRIERCVHPVEAAVEYSADSSPQVGVGFRKVRVAAVAPKIVGDGRDRRERAVGGDCYSMGKPQYHDQVQMSSKWRNY
jgi:hypothetical protein